jgi:uncharacterized repeat protein (TIGR02543 family)
MSKHAVNAGQGEEVAPLAVTGLTATDVGTNMPYNNGSVNLSWTLPSNSNPATLYTVTSNPATTTQTTSSTSYTFTGLASNTAYTFTVVPSNTHGSGPGTTSSSVTATTVPQAPTIGTASDTGSSRPYNNGLATVAFTAGATGGKSITSFTATASAGGYNGSGASSPVTVAGLQSAASYTYTVTATNANGTSAASSASNSVTCTTVPAAPAAPSVTSPNPSVGVNVAGGSTDTVSWSAPSNGGSGITSYYLYDNGGAVGNVGNVTSYSIGEGGGTNHYFAVAAINANGQSATSSNSGTVTTFSFTPFSFAPFSFTPFGFTPFGFTPFGFTPFGFTPFGFTPFGFTPFGFTPFGFFNVYGAHSLGFLTNVRTPNGLVPIANMKVGDSILTSNIDNVPVVKSEADIASLDSWTSTPTSVYGNELTQITNLYPHIATTIIIINGEYFTEDHRIMINRDGIVSIVATQNINQLTDLVWSYNQQAWVPITQYQIVESTSYEVISVQTSPIQWFYTEDMLVYDSAADTDAGIAAAAAATHSVIFMGDDATSVPMPPQTSAIPADLSPNTLTRDGYTFAGWNTEADGSGTAYDDQANYNFAADLTLYAQWKQS